MRLWNSELLVELSTLDKVVVPTSWQKSQFPSFFQAGLHVIHEGVDYQQLSLLKKSKINYPTYLPDSPNIEVLTYVSRCFESYRGFPQIIELISKLQSQRPNLHVVLVGQDGSAGGPPDQMASMSIWAKNTFHLDPSRTHWVVPCNTEYRNVLAISDVHVYRQSLLF